MPLKITQECYPTQNLTAINTKIIMTFDHYLYFKKITFTTIFTEINKEYLQKMSSNNNASSNQGDFQGHNSGADDQLPYLNNNPSHDASSQIIIDNSFFLCSFFSFFEENFDENIRLFLNKAEESASGFILQIFKCKIKPYFVLLMH